MIFGESLHTHVLIWGRAFFIYL